MAYLKYGGSFKQLGVIFAKNSRFICLKTVVKINNMVNYWGSYSEEYYKLSVQI